MATLKTRLKDPEFRIEAILVALVFLLTFAWSLTSPSPGGPDEPMRYLIPKYLYSHPGKLPNGYDESIRNATWGISYGFYPIVSYMLSAVCMWVVSIFTTSRTALLHAARFAGVIWTAGTAVMVLKIGRTLFRDGRRWLFAVLVMFLPGLVFLGTYVNVDAMALFACSVIMLAWSRYLKEDWTTKNCAMLAVGMALCLLSYYNAYGWVLWSFFFFCTTNLLFSDLPFKERFRLMIRRGLFIALIVLILAGWWFIRNAVLYNGDFLGREASRICGELYAKPAYKPSLHTTPQRQGMSVRDMLFYVSGGWDHNWMIMTLYSFIGTFGHYDIFMSENVSKTYTIFLFIGLLGVFLMLREFYWKKVRVEVAKKPEEGIRRRKTITVLQEWNRFSAFHFFLLLAGVTPVVLLVQYSYTSDLQAQGRYIMSGVFAVMYFVTAGYGMLLGKLVKKPKVREILYRIVSMIWIVGTVLSYFILILPSR